MRMNSSPLALLAIALCGSLLGACSSNTIGSDPMPMSSLPGGSPNSAGPTGPNGSPNNPGDTSASPGNNPGPSDPGTVPGEQTPGNTTPGTAPPGPQTPTGTDPNPGTTPTPGTDTPADPAYPTPRIRRMTNAEFEASVQQLLGTSTATQAAFVPDAKQSGFARNAAQVVDPLYVRQLQDTSDTLAAEYVSTKLSAALPCASSGDAACATTFFTDFLPRAFRRAVTADEVKALVDGVYSVGAQDDGFNAGMQLAISAALQSAAFIYHTELGADGVTGNTTLTPSEIGAQLAYMFTGAPPDADLLATVTDGSIADSATRTTQAQRLLATPAAKTQVIAMIEQWLGIDGLVNIGKDNAQFADYEAQRPHMLQETGDFITEVVFNQGGSIRTLFGADYTVADQEMIKLYAVGNQDVKAPTDGTNHVSLAGTARRGILNQASFLARFATEIESAPVRRGVAVGRRVMCVTIPDPTALNITVTPPPPDKTKSVRERFSQHSTDPDCSSCHAGIDAVGFTFEDFDAIGQYKADQDTGTTLPDGWKIDLPQADLSDSGQLADLLSQSNDVKRCFARNMTRFAGAETNSAVEDYFISMWQGLEAAKQDSIVELLVAYAASDIFVTRAPGASQ